MARVWLALVFVVGCTSPNVKERPSGDSSAGATTSGDAEKKGAPPAILPTPSDSEHAANLVAARKRSPIKPDEEVILFPSMGRFDKDANLWRIPVHGWIYEPEDEDFIRKRMTQALASTINYAHKLEGEIFESRIKPFAYDNESRKEVPIETGASITISRSSTNNGHFTASATINAGDALRLAEQRHGRSPPPMLPLHAVTRADDDRRFDTRAFLIPERGLTIVSDIDDTVKISEVTDRAKLLTNTFLEPFRPVPGMAEAYGSWLHRADGSHLHFVSSCPWQLYPAVLAMLDTAGFPPATFDLKQIRFKDPSIVDLFKDPEITKRRTIEAVLEAFPSRSLALVGDSGEKDPEVYGDLARDYPDRIVYIAVRNVTKEPKDAPRYAHTFRNLDTKWEVFSDPTELSGPP